MKLSSVIKIGRQIQIRGMAYAPTTELGVVCLFGRLAPQLGFCIETVRPQFCDCIATRRGARLRVEFEYWASSFARHKHDPKGADIVVCWENDWEGRPKRYQHLEIISLKDRVGAMPKVFIVGCVESQSGHELKYSKVMWNVPAGAQVGDLLLVYRTSPTSAIKDAWKITGPFKNYSETNPGGYYPGLQAWMKKIATFSRPLTFAALANHPKAKDLAVVRKRFQGKTEITDYWPLFYNLLVKTDRGARAALKQYRPD